MKDEEDFVNRLGCRQDELLKVVSIFGNTGEGKSHTLNHTFFLGREVFKTSPTQESCTVGVWAAMDPVHRVVVIDTEGLLGAGMGQIMDLFNSMNKQGLKCGGRESQIICKLTDFHYVFPQEPIRVSEPGFSSRSWLSLMWSSTEPMQTVSMTISSSSLVMHRTPT